MEAIVNAIQFVTGPLTLVAFLAVILLALFRRSVKDQRGLEYLYSLARDKLTRAQFYSLASKLIDRFFWALIIVLLGALSAYVWIKIGTTPESRGTRFGGDTIITGKGDDVVVTGGGDAHVNRPESVAGDIIVSRGRGNLISGGGGGNIIVSGRDAGLARIPNRVPKLSPEQRSQSQYRIDVLMNQNSLKPVREIYGLRNICEVDTRYCSLRSIECEDFEEICQIYIDACQPGEINQAKVRATIEDLEEDPETFCVDQGKLCANDAAWCREPGITPTDSMPAGVYGFQPPWLIGQIDLEQTDTWQGEAAGAAAQEIHRRPGGQIALAGFVDQNTAVALSGSERSEPVDIQLFSRPEGKARHAVSIPIERVDSFIYGGAQSNGLKIAVW